MMKNIFRVLTLLALGAFNSASWASAAAEADQATPTPLFRVALKPASQEDNPSQTPSETDFMYIVGTQHLGTTFADWSPVLQEEFKRVASLSNVYAIMESFNSIEAYQAQVKDILENRHVYGALSLYEQSLSLESVTRYKSAFNCISIAVFMKSRIRLGEPIMHPQVIDAFVRLKPEMSYDAICNQTADVQIVRAFFPSYNRGEDYLESIGDYIQAENPEESLRDPVKFQKALVSLESFAREVGQSHRAPSAQASVNLINQKDLLSQEDSNYMRKFMSFTLDYPTLQLYHGTALNSMNFRNKKWKERLEQHILPAHPDQIPVIMAGATHLGGETGLLKMAKSLGRRFHPDHSSSIYQLLSDGNWRQIDMSEEWFLNLPPEAPLQDKLYHQQRRDAAKK